MSLYGLIAPKGKSGFGYGSTALEVTQGLDLQGKHYWLTGCAAGLGFESLRVLTLRGAHVFATARHLSSAKDACSKVNESHTTALACDLSEPASIREAISTFRKTGILLDGILCNAGIMALPTLTLQHGLESQFFTNHVGHFILVNGLLPSLKADARIVVVSSGAHMSAPKEGIQFNNLDGSLGYGPWTQYAQSKFANILFAKALSKRFAGTPRTANALHPGVIDTKLGRHLPAVARVAYAIGNVLALKDVHQGASTSLYALTHPLMRGVTGEYLSHCNIAKPRSDANDAALAERLWETTEKIVENLP